MGIDSRRIAGVVVEFARTNVGFAISRGLPAFGEAT
jgi:hypothetical protein